MKKRLSMLMLLLITMAGIMCTADAQTPVPLKIRQGDAGNHPLRDQISVPTVYIDGYTLLIEGDHPDYTLQLVDANDDVVYSVFVPAGTTTVILPSTYAGDYTLQLLWGNWMFYGEITL